MTIATPREHSKRLLAMTSARLYKVADAGPKIIGGKLMHVVVPPLGEYAGSLALTKWLRKAGDYVKQDEPIVELETDKVVVEIPAPIEGRIQAVLASEGATVSVGDRLCLIHGSPEETETSVDFSVTARGHDFENMMSHIRNLTEQVELLRGSHQQKDNKTNPPPSTSHKRIFVVHGRDDLVKLTVARFVEALGFEAIVLHEQDDCGRTIIEKFEQNADVDFAVVLMTPDDIGALVTEAHNLRPRARQNVILELGYFIGSLGRSKVMVLVKDSIDLPSDYIGVVYTAMDRDGAWKIRLARELKAAGLPVDFEKAAHA